MIEIKYFENNPRCFSLSFLLSDYIPQKYFEIHPNGEGAELEFYVDLLKKHSMFFQSKESIHIIIYDVVFDCTYNGIPFSMHYDDWDFVDFASNPEHKETIAVHIKELIEAQKSE